MFLPNPEFKSFLTPFQNNLLRNYIAEYNLEGSRDNGISRNTRAGCRRSSCLTTRREYGER